MQKINCIFTILLVASLFFPEHTLGFNLQHPEKAHHELQSLIRSSGEAVLFQWNSKTNTPSLLSGRLSKPSNHSPEWIAGQFAGKVKRLYGLTHSANQLRISEVSRNGLTGTIVHFEHLLYNTPVWGDGLSVEIDYTGVIQRVYGTIHPFLEKKLFYRPMVPSFSEKKAIDVAMNSLGLNTPFISPPQIVPYYLPMNDGSPLIYVVTIHHTESNNAYTVFIHALSGRIIDKKPARQKLSLATLIPTLHSTKGDAS